MSGPVSFDVTAIFPLVLVYMCPCACSPRVEFLFPPVLCNFFYQTPLVFKARFSGVSSSCCQTPRLGSLKWGSEISLQWENFCSIIVFQFVGHPPVGHEIWFYCYCTPPTMSLWLFFVFGCRVSFLVCYSIFIVSDCSAVGCDFGVLVRRDEHTSFCYVILSSPTYWGFLKCSFSLLTWFQLG